MPKDPQIKLTVSTATFGEIAAALEQQGFKLGVNVAEIVLAKGTELKQPVDFRLATIRRDAGTIAAQAFNASDMGVDFVQFIDQIYQYILNEHKPPNIYDEAKAEAKATLPTAANLVDKINKWK